MKQESSPVDTWMFRPTGSQLACTKRGEQTRESRGQRGHGSSEPPGLVRGQRATCEASDCASLCRIPVGSIQDVVHDNLCCEQRVLPETQACVKSLQAHGQTDG